MFEAFCLEGVGTYLKKKPYKILNMITAFFQYKTLLLYQHLCCFFSNRDLQIGLKLGNIIHIFKWFTIIESSDG